MDPVIWVVRALLRKPPRKVSRSEALDIALQIIRSLERPEHDIMVHEGIDAYHFSQMMAMSGGDIGITVDYQTGEATWGETPY